MSQLTFEGLRQRADLTHRYNSTSGRHGWLRLTPAYSIRVVEEVLDEATGRPRVLDPFSGTATTALCAAYRGYEATTTDINPFLVWLGHAKTTTYSPSAVQLAHKACAEALAVVNSSRMVSSEPPPIHNIERWWSPDALRFLCRLRDAIDSTAAPDSEEGMLLRIAFCRTLIACSNAAFNHQSMSFKSSEEVPLGLQMDYPGLFRGHVASVTRGAHENPSGKATVLLHDARRLRDLKTAQFDLVVTSPPYANRMSYIRELRPYMYWLRFLTSGRDAGELDWLAIGGTWGVATSRLNEWRPGDKAYSSAELEETLTRMSRPINANGALLATYVRKYCVDMALHFDGLRAVLRAGAKLHYIVGNSTFYGELLSVERIYAHIMSELGYVGISIRPIRKRNSNKSLVEFDVSATFEG